MTVRSRSHLVGYVLVVLAAACWATGGLLARWLFVSEIALSPVDLSATRAVVSAMLLLPGVGFLRRSALRITARDIGFLAVFGIAGQALLHLAYYEAIAAAGVAPAILLEYLAPIIVLAVSVLFLGDRPTWTLPVGVLLAITGCGLVVGVVGGSTPSVSGVGIGWGVAAAGFFAAYMILGQAAATRLSPWTLITYGLCIAALFWIGAIGPGRIVELLCDPSVLAAVGYVAVVSTILPFVLFLTALRHLDATRAGVTATIEPVIAGAAAWVILGETLSWLQIAGALLVVSAIVVVQIPEPVASRVPPGA